MENAIEKINCPVCHKQDSRLVGIKNKYRLYRSNFCGLLFVWPVPKDTLEIYGAGYFKGATGGFGYMDYERDKEPQKSAMTKFLDKIQSHIPAGKIFDTGAASGFFIELAAKRRWEASGVEISEYASGVARSKGLMVLTGTIHHPGITQKTYDAVSMLDVLEHATEPDSEIKRAGELLRPGGILAINTPDSGSFWARIWGIHWHLVVPPEHLFLFGRKSIRLLLEKNGFKVLEETKIGKSFSLAYIFRMLHSWSGLRIFAFLANLAGRGLIGKISLPVNLRDNMFILASKT